MKHSMAPIRLSRSNYNAVIFEVKHRWLTLGTSELRSAQCESSGQKLVSNFVALR